MHSQTISMAYNSRFYSVAPLLCQKKLADVERAYEGEELDDSGVFGEEHPGYTWHVSVKKIISEFYQLNCPKFGITSGPNILFFESIKRLSKHNHEYIASRWVDYIQNERVSLKR